MFIIGVVLVAVAPTVLIWVLTNKNKTGNRAEDEMASIPAVFATTLVWCVAFIVMLTHWLL